MAFKFLSPFPLVSSSPLLPPLSPTTPITPYNPPNIFHAPPFPPRVFSASAGVICASARVDGAGCAMIVQKWINNSYAKLQTGSFPLQPSISKSYTVSQQVGPLPASFVMFVFAQGLRLLRCWTVNCKLVAIWHQIEASNICNFVVRLYDASAWAATVGIEWVKRENATNLRIQGKQRKFRLFGGQNGSATIISTKLQIDCKLMEGIIIRNSLATIALSLSQKYYTQ